MVLFSVRLQVALAINVAVAVLGQATLKESGPEEPFPELYGYCSTCAPQRPESPDPLVRYTWNKDVNASQLQIYRIERPSSYVVDPPNSITGAESLSPGATGPLTIEIHGAGSLRLDWGTERAAWIEFESPDLAEQMKKSNNTISVKAAISEFNEPYPGKTHEVKQYGNTYRLETNDELYEGVRFTWLWFDAPLNDVPWHINRISLVSKVKPINYTGSFESSDKILTQTWYTGAYGVRLNMEADEFNSILIERGDRVAIQGDGHTTMAASLVAFSPYNLVKDMLDQTNSGSVHGHNVVDQSIMAYPIYWTMSVNDWFMASGNVKGFLSLAPDVMSIIDNRINDFLQPNLDIVWFGWDDRVGNGWCGHWIHENCNREAHLAFASLVVRACRDLGRSLRLAGELDDAIKYEKASAQLFQKLKDVPEWPKGFGVHAAANAINTGYATHSDIEKFFETLNDSTTVCSHSPFNQYWILQAFGNAGKMDHALASIKLCWGPMLTLGKGCFWELFSPDWASFMSEGDKGPTMPSYCHPWSSGVTAWLSNVMGGIQPLLPGYSEYIATPYVSDRNERVSTVVPTPHGPIEVNATVQHDNIGEQCSSGIEISVKSDVPGYIGIWKRDPESRKIDCSIDPKNILVDGKQTNVVPKMVSAGSLDAGWLALWGHFIPTKTTAFVFVRIPEGGSHIIRAVYRGKDCQVTSDDSAKKTTAIPHIPPFPEPRYRATTGLDRIGGDGLSTYGADGYVLLGFDNGTDLSKLPPYIKNVTFYNHGFGGKKSLPRQFVGTSKDDSAYLPDPRSTNHFTNKDRRMLGLVSQDDNQDILIDVASAVGGRDAQKASRALGMISQGDSTGWEAGIVLDVETANGTSLQGRMEYENLILDVDKAENSIVDENNKPSFRLSIYCVATDSQDKHAIRVMDLDTLDPIAPAGFVSEYMDGVWWSVRYNNSIRLRIMAINGIRISAVAFSDGSMTETIGLQQSTA